MKHKGRLLIVEKNYSCTMEYGNNTETIREREPSGNSALAVKDVVDREM